MKVIVCIPARYGSTRFPGKVLAKDTGKFLIEHTWRQACLAKLPCRVIIAADDRRVLEAAQSFGAECLMTRSDHKSGTDRIAEAVQKIDCDIVINLQADEPEIDPANIDRLAQLLIATKNSPQDARRKASCGLRQKLKTQNYQMATLATDFKTPEEIADPDIVKVIVGSRAQAIYFSRSPIPYHRQKRGIGPLNNYLRHIGIYAYRKKFLLQLTALPQTMLERAEKLEQLRAIENGFAIMVAKVKHACSAIDTPQQYAQFVKRYKARKVK